jgi:hypothetical protein
MEERVMNDSKVNLTELQSDLEKIAAGGISADRRRLKEDMCAQFADHREWIRELVVNSYDANAHHVWISGFEEEATLTIVVADDGDGMDRQSILDYMHVYRSRKRGERKVVGQHGIGKLSIAAIPGQCRFSMTTSTGKECWRMETGSLLDESPIDIQRVEPVLRKGTCVKVTFQKQNSLEEEMEKLTKILHRYVRFLPMEIIFRPRHKAHRRSLIYEDWYTSIGIGQMGRCYRFTIAGAEFEALLGVDVAEHEVYQHRVLIATKYDLLFQDMDKKLYVPHLRIRVDSSDFKLPFGRHCLCNEEILIPLARHLRKNVLPAFMRDLHVAFMSQSIELPEVSPHKIEEMACSLIGYNDSPDQVWCSIPLFMDVHHNRHSLHELRHAVREFGVLYLENEEPGVDYSAFHAPVLSQHQVRGGLSLLQRIFREELINRALRQTTFSWDYAGNIPSSATSSIATIRIELTML